jgi:hypothetical protein
MVDMGWLRNAIATAYTQVKALFGASSRQGLIDMGWLRNARAIYVEWLLCTGFAVGTDTSIDQAPPTLTLNPKHYTSIDQAHVCVCV